MPDPSDTAKIIQHHLGALKHVLSKMDEEIAKLQRRRELAEFHLKRLEFELSPKQEGDPFAFFRSALGPGRNADS